MHTATLIRSGACAGLLAAVLAGGAIAQTPPAAVATTDQAPALTIRQVYDQLQASGFRDVREIEWSDGRYEVKARNAQGERVRLEVDGQTGAVTRNRVRR